MSDFQIDGVKYEILWATDIPARDGIACELRSVKLAPHGMSLERKLLAEVFRDDEKRKIVFSGFAKNVPLAAIEQLLRIFNQGGGRDFME
ncbi:hypothetical protein ACFQT0_06400 [Hymenobacter humi]|uniref:Uncharacterized protein n=1 Tax=Hymenobacter humi TaxID=1411620 RepID=A0ABW2U3M9_9BACT